MICKYFDAIMRQMGQMGHMECLLLRERAMQTISEQERAEQSRAKQSRAKQIRAVQSNMLARYRHWWLPRYLLFMRAGRTLLVYCTLYMYITRYSAVISNRRAIAMAWVAALAVPPVSVPVHGSTYTWVE